MKNREKKGIIVLVLITILVLYFSLKDNFVDILIGLVRLNPFWLLMGLIFVFGYYYFRGLSLYVFTKKFKGDISFITVLRMVLITQFFDGITPSSSGGQPYQMYALSKLDIGVIEATNITIQNFIVYQIALILLGLVAVILNCFFNLYEGVGPIKYFIFLGFLINILVALVLFALAFMKNFNKVILSFVIKILSKLKIFKDSEKMMGNINNYINNFHDGAIILLSNRFDFFKTIVYNFLALLLIYMVPAIIIYGFGNFSNVNIVYYIITSAYIMLIGSFIPIPGGTGGLEYAFVRFYGVFISGNLLTIVMLVWRFLTYYLGVIVGAILLNFGKKR